VRIGRFSGALPLVLMAILILAVGAFATVRQDAFLTSFNLHNLLLLTMPLALVTLGQTCALLVGGFDVSVAALMTFCVVVASYTMAFDKSGWALLPGGLVLIAVGLAVGIFNAVLIRRSSRRSGLSASSRAHRSSFGITPKGLSRVTPSVV
jgi:ribose/xylose/arabinose/galactoside ABC-type transport system permease subunit